MFESYPDIVTVDEVMVMLGIGKSTIYSLLRNNAIPHVRVGRKYIIPKASVVGFLKVPRYNRDG